MRYLSQIITNTVAGATGPTGSTGATGATGSGGGGGASTPNAVSDQVNTSTGYFALPSGTTAQRPVSPQGGFIRYNTDLGALDFYSSIGWFNLGYLDATSVSPNTFNGQSGSSFTITGLGFQAGATVKFITNDLTEYTAGSVSVANSTTIIATTPQNFTVAQEPLSVKVINPGGLSDTLTNVIDCGGVPTWSTASGSLGSFYDNAISTTYALSASDPDANSTITFSQVSGSLPNNFTLLSNGFIYGTTQSVNSTTTYNFTVAASDSANNQTNRAFSITVIATNYFGNGSDGAGVY